MNILNFPNIVSEGHTKTSEFDWSYNCIAWAVAEDKTRWWWPLLDLQGNEGYWPKSVPRNLSLAAFTKLFKGAGYKICDDGLLEEGFIKIAIFAASGKATHAARQLPDGNWTHKMGADIDMTASLKAVEGPVYGSVVRYMKKAIA